MGTHPIFESDFDCLTEKALTLKMARHRRKGGELWGDFLKTADQGPVESNPKGMSIYYCEMCDKDLKTEEAKETHFAEHIKCGHPGCKFEAHFLVIEKHIRMCHGNGYGAINLETEEDIKKWREERRAKYPTRARIAEKKALGVAQNDRGQKIQSKKFDMREKRDLKRKAAKLKAKDKSGQKKALVQYSSSGSDESSTEPESASEDENEKTEKEKEPNAAAKRFHSTFVAKVSDNIKTQPNYETLFNNKLLRSHLTNIQKNGRKVRYPVGSYKDMKTGNREMPLISRPPLLEMLLKDEIRKERNRILQAVHYIVKNKFFD